MARVRQSITTYVLAKNKNAKYKLTYRYSQTLKVENGQQKYSYSYVKDIKEISGKKYSYSY